MSINILFVEDSPHKRSCIVEYVDSLNLGISLAVVCSFNSASRALENKEYTAILLI